MVSAASGSRGAWRARGGGRAVCGEERRAERRARQRRGRRAAAGTRWVPTFPFFAIAAASASMPVVAIELLSKLSEVIVVLVDSTSAHASASLSTMLQLTCRGRCGVREAVRGRECSHS